MATVSKTSFMVLILTIGAFGAAAPPAAAASTLDVCASGCSFSDIPSALAAAATGDTIVVRPGVYVGAVTVSKSVTLCSGSGAACKPDASKTILDGGIDNAVVVAITADDATLRGFTVRNPRFSVTDQTFGAPVAPALVLVDADRATVADNLLTQPATAPAQGATRSSVSMIDVLSGDDLVVRGNTMSAFVPAMGLGATCTTAPCEAFGIWNRGGGDGMLVEGNDIRTIDADTPSTAIQFTDNARVVIEDNFIRLNGAAPGSGPLSTGIETTSAASGVIVRGNDIATGLVETYYGAYGAFGVFRDSLFVDNDMRVLQHAIMLRTAVPGGNTVEGNYFYDNAQGVLNYAQGTLLEGNTFYLGNVAVLLDDVGVAGSSSGVVLRENTFRNHTTFLGITESVSNTTVDARENDWGSYSSETIALRLDDNGVGNSIDFSCFIDNDRTTRVCPTASFTSTLLGGARWPKSVELNDTSVSGGRTIESREWTFPDGTNSTDATPVVALGPGAHAVTLEVTDAEGFTDAITQTITLANAAPALTLAGSYAASENATFTLDADATDADGDTVAYALASGPAGMKIHAATGVVTWKTDHRAAGAHPFSVRVDDGGASTLVSSTVVIGDVPVAPVLDDVTDKTVAELKTLTIDLRATSANGTAPTFAATGLPAGATLASTGPGTARITYTPASGTAGTHTVTVVASADGLADDDTFQIRVLQDVNLRLDRLGGSPVLGSPGQTVTLPARLTNLGSSADGFTFTVTTTDPWSIAAPADLSLAAGANATVDLPVTIPTDADSSIITLKACSIAQPSKCAEVRYRIDVPLVVRIEMEPSYTPTELILGRVIVTSLDGSPVAGRTVSLAESADFVAPVKRLVNGTTDANGELLFELAEIPSRSPGLHTVSVTVENRDLDGSASVKYQAALV